MPHNRQVMSTFCRWGALPPRLHRWSDGRMAEAVAPEFAAVRCLDESSDSEPEQEPGTPQKLIRKVSTSGQIRSKVEKMPCDGGSTSPPAEVVLC